MASLKIVSRAIGREAADLSYEEIANFVNVRNSGVVKKQRDKALYLDDHLKSTDLEKTSALVADFFSSTGRKLAAEFFYAQNATLQKSFLVLYCARELKKINTGVGRVTIFLALEKLSFENGLPKFGNNAESYELQSGDTILVGKNTLHILEKNNGEGFALVSDWSV
ncbi:hypothetical protein B0O99DRAFT_84397 [Bisporella sp. PMI_857]|nr:hypothetical protein B0O99DRAFT_84397 [Bisporella sp. PMI_857]